MFEAFSWNFQNAQEIDIDYIRSLKMNYFDQFLIENKNICIVICQKLCKR